VGEREFKKIKKKKFLKKKLLKKKINFFLKKKIFL